MSWPGRQEAVALRDPIQGVEPQQLFDERDHLGDRTAVSKRERRQRRRRRRRRSTDLLVMFLWEQRRELFRGLATHPLQVLAMHITAIQSAACLIPRGGGEQVQRGLGSVLTSLALLLFRCAMSRSVCSHHQRSSSCGRSISTGCATWNGRRGGGGGGLKGSMLMSRVLGHRVCHGSLFLQAAAAQCGGQRGGRGGAGGGRGRRRGRGRGRAR